VPTLADPVSRLVCHPMSVVSGALDELCIDDAIAEQEARLEAQAIDDALSSWNDA
jgi:hypothetical protein